VKKSSLTWRRLHEQETHVSADKKHFRLEDLPCHSLSQKTKKVMMNFAQLFHSQMNTSLRKCLFWALFEIKAHSEAIPQGVRWNSGARCAWSNLGTIFEALRWKTCKQACVL